MTNVPERTCLPHQAAERDFWASLYRTARAQFLQHEAEARRTLAVERRAYAEAKSDAVQTVMRYVCHELRNPLHGIMVRPALRACHRSDGASRHCWPTSDRRVLRCLWAWQGLLEGVKGELGELEAWVAQDVDTVWNAATGMAVVLNDVLDLGQVSKPRRRRSRHCCALTAVVLWPSLQRRSCNAARWR